MKRFKPVWLVAAGVLTVAAAVAASAAGASQPAEPFDAQAYLAHVKYLAGDELAGRATGSPGAALAAEYIAQKLAAAGCQPAGPDGSWFQPFEVRLGKEIAEQEAALRVEGLERQWKLGLDWTPLPFSEMAEVEGPLAFAGYGIQASEFNYDDYGDFDAAGKVLLILRYEPKSADPEATFGGETPSSYATFVRKARTAHKRGAKALLIVNPPNRSPDRDELYAFDTLASQQTFYLPMAQVSRELAEAILRRAGQPDLKTLQQKLDQERKPLACDLGLKITLHTGLKPAVLNAKNVMGLIPGDGSTAETVVVGAHYDHLGLRPPMRGDDPTPQIHNGADDNASGTAGVIELARVIAAGPPGRRNILFIAFDGEEIGLCGSRHFVAHPTVPLEQIRAMLNLDMIGRLRQGKLAVLGTGSAAELPDLVEQAATPLGLEYRAPAGVADGSDHVSFASRSIPVLFLFTGVHKEYHQPEDDWELIDADGAVKVLQLAHQLVMRLANLPAGPTYTQPTGEVEADLRLPRPAVEEQKEELERAASQPAAARESDEPPSRSALRVRLGIIPDMVGDGQPGMLIDTVLDGGCAKAAGLKDGDRIMRIGTEPIRDIYAYMRVLQSFKPGEEVDIVVIRGGQELTIKVRLQASDYRRGKD